MTLATSVPMEAGKDANRLLVPVTINGVDARLFIDTGAVVSTINTNAFAQAALLNPSGRLALTGVGGHFYAGVACVKELKLGRLRGPVEASYAFYPKQFIAERVLGNLGLDIVGNYDIDLDLWGGRLSLYKTSGSCSNAITLLAAPRYTVDYLPGKMIRIPVAVGGRRYAALLDTGATSSAISHAAALRMGITEPMLLQDPHVSLGGFGPDAAQGRVHTLASLAIGALTFHRVKVVVFDTDVNGSADVILGMNLVRRVHLWMSNSTHRLLMQYPPSASL